MKGSKDSVLYVDDELFNLELFKEAFIDEYNIFTETSTKRAFELIKSHPIKVIISDQRMPEESGLLFLERVHKEFPDIIKIVFTAYLDHDTALHAINQGGIYRYLLKPWNNNEIQNALTSAIREYDLRNENKILFQELSKKKKELEIALAQSKENEQKFYNIFTNSNDGIVIIKDDKLLEANPAFLKLMCPESDQNNIIYVHNFLITRYNQFFNTSNFIPKNVGKSIIEFEMKNAVNEKKFIELSNNSIEYQGQKAVLSIIRDITERKHLEYKIMEAIIRTQEEDQCHYAQELHDGLGPILSTIKMYIEWIIDPNNTVNKEKIMEKSIYSINEAIILLKEIANNLSPHVLQRYGLIDALQTYVDLIKSAKDIEFIISNNLKTRLPDNLEINLYRVLLECINNSIKHSCASKILTKFKKEDNKLILNYSDNGKGFNVEEVMKARKGMGLFNMKNRIKLLGGEFQIKSNIDIGTDIEIKIDV
jgi:PAS domain S-box-containing protein